METVPLAPPVKTITGADLVANAPSIQWQEAVAVTLRLVEAVKQLGVACAPDLDHVQLSADGAVAVLPDAEWSDQLVAKLAAIARALLQDPSTPPELARLVTQAADGAVSGQDLDGFAKSLAEFEHSGRESAVHDLVERIATFSQPASMEEELQRLMARAHAAAETPPAARPRAFPGLDAQRRRQIGIVAIFAVAIVGGITAGAWVALRPTAVLPVPKISRWWMLTEAPSLIATGDDSKAAAAVKPVLPVTAPPQPAPVPRTDTRDRRPLRPESRRTKGAEVPPPPAGASGLGASARPAASSGAAVRGASSAMSTRPTPDANPATTQPDTQPGRIYSVADRGVTPPVPLPPLVGHMTTDPVVIPGDMDVLIGPSGDVERITLLAGSRYEDQMLVYAMKNGKFRPAMADGRPVRYLLRLRTRS